MQYKKVHYYLNWHRVIATTQSTGFDIKWTPFGVEIVLYNLHKSQQSTKLRAATLQISYTKYIMYLQRSCNGQLSKFTTKHIQRAL